MAKGKLRESLASHHQETFSSYRRFLRAIQLLWFHTFVKGKVLPTFDLLPPLKSRSETFNEFLIIGRQLGFEGLKI